MIHVAVSSSISVGCGDGPKLGDARFRFFFAVFVSRFPAVSGEWQPTLGDGEVGSEAMVHLSCYFWYSRPNLGQRELTGIEIRKAIENIEKSGGK